MLSFLKVDFVGFAFSLGRNGFQV